jgi:hypothetical protein
LKCDDGSDDSLVGEHSPFICTPKWVISGGLWWLLLTCPYHSVYVSLKKQ